MYSGTFLIVGLAWQGHQSANIPCQDEGGDLSFLEYLTRHVYGRLPCRFFNTSTPCPPPRLTDRVGGIPLHLFIPPTRLLPSSSRATGLEGQLAKRFIPARQMFDTTTLEPLPFGTTPFQHSSPEMSTLHLVYPSPGLPPVNQSRRQSAGGELLQRNSIERPISSRNHSQGEPYHGESFSRGVMIRERSKWQAA